MLLLKLLLTIAYAYEVSGTKERDEGSMEYAAYWTTLVFQASQCRSDCAYIPQMTSADIATCYSALSQQCAFEVDYVMLGTAAAQDNCYRSGDIRSLSKINLETFIPHEVQNIITLPVNFKNNIIVITADPSSAYDGCNMSFITPTSSTSASCDLDPDDSHLILEPLPKFPVIEVDSTFVSQNPTNLYLVGDKPDCIANSTTVTYIVTYTASFHPSGAGDLTSTPRISKASDRLLSSLWWFWMYYSTLS